MRRRATTPRCQHCIDTLPEPDVLEPLDRSNARGNTGATRAAEADRNLVGVEAAPIRLPVGDSSTRPKLAETAGAGYESAALTR